MTPEEKLASAIDRELKRLPDRAAPVSLAPAVLSRIGKLSTRPWWQRAWFDWPVPCRAISLLLAGTIFWFIFAASTGSDTAGPLQPLFTLLSAIGLVVRAFASASMSIIAQAIQSIPPTLMATMLFVCAAAWTTCFGLGAICLRYVKIRR